LSSQVVAKTPSRSNLDGVFVCLQKEESHNEKKAIRNMRIETRISGGYELFEN
jgi:hypothetical protein